MKINMNTMELGLAIGRHRKQGLDLLWGPLEANPAVFHEQRFRINAK